MGILTRFSVFCTQSIGRKMWESSGGKTSGDLELHDCPTAPSLSAQHMNYAFAKLFDWLKNSCKRAQTNQRKHVLFSTNQD